MVSHTEIAQRLKIVFGYDSFRPLQREIMEANLDGKDLLAILPTGGGKSLCYQLPSLMREGLTVVVSPLKALMKDQVDQMKAAGVAATFLNSSIDSRENQSRLAGLREGKYRLLYVAPERLFMEGFIEQLKGWKLSALAVDEAHCISEWGHSFKPDYRKLGELRGHLPGIPIMALTATATERVRRDIANQLRLANPEIYVASFNRPNLSYSVTPKRKPKKQICEYAKSRADASGIVYCLARQTTEDYAAALNECGIKAVPYHAGLSDSERERNQEAFIRDDVQVVCATIAFGMGINKPNVRYVLHADLPKNVESYYQETGRAGRDGLPSECMLLFSGADIVKLRRFIAELEDENAARIAEQQLRQMGDFAENTGCRRASLLRYFGEHLEGDSCESCDNCLNGHEKVNVTTESRKLIACVYHINKQGYAMGLRHAVDVLRGSKNAKVLNKGHDKLKTYGIGEDHPVEYWLALGKQLTQHGYFSVSDDGYSTLTPTKQAIRECNDKEEIWLVMPALKALKAGSNAGARPSKLECDNGLFEVLRQLRKRLADEQGVPPYVVFGDVSLRQMARSYPMTEDSFLAISGVGERRLVDYGDAFIKAIGEWLDGNERKNFDGGLSLPQKAEPDETEQPDKSSVKGLRELALEIGNTGKSREMLINMFLHTDYEVRRRSCSAAAKIADASIVTHIGPCLNADEAQVRQYALKAIYKSRCRSLLEEVRELESIEDKDYNQRLISKILSALE